MIKSASVRITVDFTGVDRPQRYLVEMEPEGGAAVGKWSGSGHIDDENQITFKHVPPGRYVLHGHPNPSSAGQQTERLTLDLVGGKASEVTLSAK